MGLAVENIINLPLLEGASIVTAKNRLSERIVEWVSVIENPVENFVRDNEFVLSTGIGCYGDPFKLLKFVEDVYNSGASVLAIATGRHVFSIPAEIIQYAEARGFIIMEIPWEIRFADIVHEIMSSLMDMRRDKADRPKDIQQQLIQMILEGKSIGQLAELIERELEVTVLIFDEKGRCAAGSANTKQIQRLKEEETDKSIEIRDSHHPMHARARKVDDEDNQLIHFTIKSNGAYKGDYYLLCEANRELALQELAIAEQGVAAAALWFSRNNAVMEAEGRMQNEFLLSLAMGHQMSADHIDAHAEFFRYDLSLPYDCIVGRPENLERLILENPAYEKPTLERINTFIKDGMLYAAENVQRRLLYAYKNADIIIFLETSKETGTDTANQFLDLVERRLSHLLPDVVFSWGIGRRKDGVWEFANSFRKAKAALDMGRNQMGIGRRTYFDETQMNRMLLNLAITKEVQQITSSIVAPLVEYDEQKGMDLIHTFTVYRNHYGNVSQTARKLNLHRQSLLYRLRKIETLTGRSLADPDHSFLLELSIRVWKTGVQKQEEMSDNTIDGKVRKPTIAKWSNEEEER
ncbi:PucR family transcriptional regulator [Sporosarcina sp. Te-1]|uniref:PucR family transcriptional regulator n=1 Tax=Sporosarcina sp. Te-1 TaxID=2818390 RepID=UPI001A9FAC9B|nr:PucR family transcriptional regulator [Sporosarcina sp. Te-1]QTD40900.1 PucR family transcriptional regulator ligand-binding domain-containing protein [Sporosarcina sp. Te-1]